MENNLQRAGVEDEFAALREGITNPVPSGRRAGTADSMAKARAARAAKVEARRRSKHLAEILRLEEEGEPRGPIRTRAEKRREIIEELDWRCPLCHLVELTYRRWVFRRDKSPCCKTCHLKTHGKTEGRPRASDPPPDHVCPECGLFKPNRHQWALAVGLCRKCVKRRNGY